MLAKCSAALLALLPLSLAAAQFTTSSQTSPVITDNDFQLVAQDNNPLGMFGAPGSNTQFVLKTVNFNLGQPSVLYVRSDLHQFHASGGHPFVGTSVQVDGVEHMQATGTWMSGSVVPRRAGEYYTTPPDVYPAGAHTATLLIEETGQNEVFEVYARPVP